MSALKNQKRISRYIISLFIFSLVLSPIFVSAASICPYARSIVAPDVEPANFTEFVCIILDGIEQLIPVVIGLTLLVFLWGLTKFIFSAGDEKNIQAGKDLMIWGVIGLFVMVSVWGIVNIVYGSFFSGDIGIPLLETDVL